MNATRPVRWSLSVLGIVAFVVLWYLVSAVFHLFPAVVLPSPVKVYTSFNRFSDFVIQNLWPTLTAGVLGFVGALVLSTLVAIVLTAREGIRRAVMPLIVGANSVPRVTLAPLIIFYVGVGTHANELIALWVAFFPMLINTMEGFDSVDEDLENLFSVIGATTWQEYRYARFMAALPSIFDGMKTGVSLAMIGAIVGEFVAANKGLGYLALFGLHNLNLELVLGVVGVMGLVTTVAVYGLYVLQSRLVFWRDVSLFAGE